MAKPDASDAAFRRMMDRGEGPDFSDPKTEWRRVFAEAWGTFLLVTVAAGAAIGAETAPDKVAFGAAVVAPGLMVMAAIYALGEVSGAHINPAVTLAFAVRGNFPWRRVPAYIVAQIVGAVAAAALLSLIFGVVGKFGTTTPEPGIGEARAVLVESLLTCGLVNIILATASGARNVGPNAAIAVGGYIALAGLWAGPLTGASMNPARSLGPAVIRGDLTGLWIYVAGPLIGAMVAVGFEWILKGPPTAEGTKAAQGGPKRG
ncbi:MAG TPA: aquaporin [Caulobacteraceae bacterium]|jgi:aquaporin Z